MKIKSQISAELNLDFPLIMAPMFLVTNLPMMEEAMRAGIAA
jgi:NAD(P)H-dependent flavin oxidoreductase YrpB (nitropropane dioxygenase family)